MSSIGDILYLIELSISCIVILMSLLWLYAKFWDAVGPSLNQRVMSDFL